MKAAAGVVLSMGLVAPALVSVPAQAADSTYTQRKVVIGKSHQGRSIVAFYRGAKEPSRVLVI
ncbi:MAG: hypothetical protein ABWY50_00330, partial [Aeromicrobium sp.]